MRRRNTPARDVLLDRENLYDRHPAMLPDASDKANRPREEPQPTRWSSGSH
jgi:hypothetical protein